MNKAIEASQNNKSKMPTDANDPYKIVNHYIFEYIRIKKSILDKLPRDRRVRTKALVDFKPSENYTPEESMTVHSFTKDTELIVMGKLSDEWLIGYIRDPQTQEESDVRIFPAPFVKLLFTTLPRPLRPYEIKDWITFGVHSAFPQGKKDGDNFTVDPRGIAMKSLDIVPFFEYSF